MISIIQFYRCWMIFELENVHQIEREREHSDIKNLIIKKFGIKITHQKKQYKS